LADLFSSAVFLFWFPEARPPKRERTTLETDASEEGMDEREEPEEHEGQLRDSTPPPAPDQRSSFISRALEDCELIYGLHPDGATEALVDYALAHNKNFAVVPCCVFSHQAPHRRIKVPKGAAKAKHQQLSRADRRKQQAEKKQEQRQESEAAAFATASDAKDAFEWVPVRTYEEFLIYLQAKHPDIQRAELAFEGRNVVLYRRKEK
jgi:hypothetical protein